jgi:DNA-binding IclR family transcriptional regulator
MIDLASDMDLDAVRVCLMRFLLFQATNSQRTGKQWTVSEIAAHLGAGNSAIKRALHSLAREGLVRRKRGQLVVTDMARLGQVRSARNPVDQSIALSLVDGF